MIAVPSTKHTDKDFAIYEEMTKFVQKCKEEISQYNKLSFSVGHIERGYYKSENKSENNKKVNKTENNVWEDVAKSLYMLNKVFSMKLHEKNASLSNDKEISNEVIPLFRIDSADLCENIITLYKEKHLSYTITCISCNRVHDSERPFLEICSDKRKSVWFNCRRSIKGIKIGELIEKPKYSKKKETLEISFISSYEWYLENLPKMEHLFVTRSDNGVNHRVYIPEVNVNKVKFGIYKLPPYDDVFAAMRKHFPNITDEEFLEFITNNDTDFYGKYNQEFVEHHPYSGDDYLISTYEKYSTEGPLLVHNKLSIIATDIEQNEKLLLPILSSLV